MASNSRASSDRNLGMFDSRMARMSTVSSGSPVEPRLRLPAVTSTLFSARMPAAQGSAQPCKDT